MSDCHSGASKQQTIALEDGSSSSATARQMVAIVGPPNAGKSTLFNRLTGLRQKVANFPGVTVEHHTGKVKLPDGREITLVDLPGVYSLNPRSDDERVTHDVLTGKMEGLPKPNSVLLILDSTNLSRHLLLAAPVLSLGLPTLVVLNMVDDLRKRQGDLDAAILASELGAPVALISAAQGEGLEKVWQFLAGSTIASAPVARRVELPVIHDIPSCHKWAGRVGRKADYRAPEPPVWTRRLDRIFLHPLGGPLVFAFVVATVFQSIFKWAQPLMDSVEAGIASSGAWLGSALPESALRSLLIDGVWAGVGSVVVFLPQILLLFLFIGILEDSGYLARAALIADRTMARVGLQGKSFIPLLSAYACAVPAIMATRTIENPRDRIATILIAPFMTCSARLPVYALLIAAFIPERNLVGGFLGTRAAAMLGLYVLGFVAAIGTAKLLKSTILKTSRATFLLEMPPYRWPNWRSLGLRIYDRGKVFLTNAGTVILVVAVILWVLANFPRQADGKPPEISNSIAGMVGKTIEPVISPLGFNWKIGIGLLTSLAAREVIVGTLGTIYGIESSGSGSTQEGLQEALRKDLSPAGAAALLVFFAFAMQCTSTIAVVRRETGSWKWPAIQFAYMSFLAYASAWITYRLVQFLS
jgi:ferrous iron transport protein B